MKKTNTIAKRKSAKTQVMKTLACHHPDEKSQPSCCRQVEHEINVEDHAQQRHKWNQRHLQHKHIDKIFSTTAHNMESTAPTNLYSLPTVYGDRI